MKKVFRFFALFTLLIICVTGCGKKCGFVNCENPVISEDGALYCEEHTCKEDGCLDVVDDGSKYCLNHKCSIDVCEQVKQEWSPYCNNHGCNKESCVELQAENSKFCSVHKCSDESCSAMKIDGSEYCTTHTCKSSGCTNYVNGTAYCDQHRCTYSGCTAERQNSLSKYCINHGCSESGCNNTVKDGQRYCSTHQCKYQGCSSRKDPNSSLGYCDYHQDIEDHKDTLIVNSNGKKIWRIYIRDGSFRFSGTYKGSGNFIVKLLDSNQNLEEVICNEIGDYIVDRSVNVSPGYHYLETYCSYGSWSATWYGTYGD